jgi:hypothetical protein
MLNPEDSDQKLGELILYISKKSVNDPDFGAVKLNKILYFSDFFAYGNWGKAITGAEYQHLRLGPAPRRLLPVRAQLEKDGALARQNVQLIGERKQVRTVNLREPNLDLFTAREISLVDDVIEQLAGRNADDVSELSHREVGWKSTREGETIPYGTIFLSDRPPTEAELWRAKELEAELMSLVATVA